VSYEIDNIELQLNNFTALSVGILDDVLMCTTYSDSSLWPCEINYLKTYGMRGYRVHVTNLPSRKALV